MNCDDRGPKSGPLVWTPSIDDIEVVNDEVNEGEVMSILEHRTIT